jgi:hypothetical protein
MRSLSATTAAKPIFEVRKNAMASSTVDSKGMTGAPTCIMSFAVIITYFVDELSRQSRD